MQKPTLKQVITIIIIITIGFLLVPSIIALVPKEYDAVKVQNASSIDVSKVSSDDFNTFRTYLIRHLRSQGMISESDTINDVSIREDTIKVSTSHSYNTQVTTSTFLVDIDSVKQTYKITIYNSTDEITDMPVQISCPQVSAMKYPDVECVGHYGDSSKKVIHHLPYETKLISGEKIIIKSITDINTLQVYLYSCDQKTPKTMDAEVLTKNWITEIGDDDNLYELNIRTGYCEGDTI